MSKPAKDTRGIGDNRPRYAAELTEQLPKDHERQIGDVDAIAKRAEDARNLVITNAEEQATVAQLIRDARVLEALLEETRKVEKEPYYSATKAVDGFFGQLTERLGRIRSAFQRKADDYVASKAAAERRERERQEQAAREAAEALLVAAQEAEAEAARLAEKGTGEAAIAAAEKTEAVEAALDQAQLAQDRASDLAAPAKTADLVRARDAGGMTTGRTDWVFEIMDYDAIPLDKLRAVLKRTEVERAIGVVVRSQKGKTDIPGVRVFEKDSAVIR